MRINFEWAAHLLNVSIKIIVIMFGNHIDLKTIWGNHPSIIETVEEQSDAKQYLIKVLNGSVMAVEVSRQILDRSVISSLRVSGSFYRFSEWESKPLEQLSSDLKLNREVCQRVLTYIFISMY